MCSFPPPPGTRLKKPTKRWPGLSFPDYYGHNLDALHDCLTDLTDTQLVITDCAVPSAKMEKWPGFLSVFFDAAEENPGLDIRLVP